MLFRTKLIVSLILLLLPLVAYHAYYRHQQYRRDVAVAEAEQMLTASTLAQATEVFLERTSTMQQAIGRALTGARWQSSADRADYLARTVAESNYIFSLAFADRSGKITVAAPASLVGSSISSYGYYREILAGADWGISGVLKGLKGDDSGLVAATAIRDARGNLLGTVVSEVDESKLLTALHSRLGPESILAIIDTSGNVALMSGGPDIPHADRDWSCLGFVRQALAGRSRVVERFELPGAPVLTGGIVPVTNVKWAAAVFVPYSQVVQPVKEQTFRDITAVAAVLVLTLIIGSLFARSMIAPIGALSRAAERLGAGDLDTRSPVPNTAEFATLARTMNQMSESIKQRDEALREAYEREKRVSGAFQQRMLPAVPPRIGNLEIATGYFPALAEAELGGDFYDVMSLPDGLVGLVIADVSGKGLGAAVHTATAKYMLQGFAMESPRPAEVVRRLNRAMCLANADEMSETFVTLFYAVLNPHTGTLFHCSAGHPPPILRRFDASTEWLGGTFGMPIGVADSADYAESESRLSVGDSLVCYTDGIIEAHRKGKWFDQDSLEEFIRNHDLPPSDLVSDLYQAVSDAVEGQVPDDVALIAVRMGGSA